MVPGHGLTYTALHFLLYLVLGVPTFYLLRRRQALKLHGRGRAECGLRLLTGQLGGHLDGVDNHWRHGTADTTAGALVWHRGRLGGYARGRVPGEPDVVVRGPLTQPRRPRVVEWVALIPWAVVYRAQVDGAVVEVAMLGRTARWLDPLMAR